MRKPRPARRYQLPAYSWQSSHTQAIAAGNVNTTTKCSIRRGDDHANSVEWIEFSLLMLATVFQVIAWRWVVERTFSWLLNDRRHSRDYERLTVNSEALIQISMIHLLIKRLA